MTGAARVRNLGAEGWGEQMVRVVCDTCGYQSRPYDTNGYRDRWKADLEFRSHQCPEQP